MSPQIEWRDETGPAPNFRRDPLYEPDAAYWCGEKSPRTGLSCTLCRDHAKLRHVAHHPVRETVIEVWYPKRTGLGGLRILRMCMQRHTSGVYCGRSQNHKGPHVAYGHSMGGVAVWETPAPSPAEAPAPTNTVAPAPAPAPTSTKPPAIRRFWPLNDSEQQMLFSYDTKFLLNMADRPTNAEKFCTPGTLINYEFQPGGFCVCLVAVPEAATHVDRSTTVLYRLYQFYRGVSRCSNRDTFNPVKARMLAFQRAILYSTPAELP